MGILKNGEWLSGPSERRHANQTSTKFHNWLTASGESGPNGENGYKAEKGRYHLYISLACPWAHRTLIFRQLMQLEDYVSITVVNPLLRDNGWELIQPEPLQGANFMYELYLKACPEYEGKVTVPVLWDKKTQTIVSNESADIIRMFNSAFNHLTGCEANYYPEPLQQQINSINERIFNGLNVGVYKAGFSRNQADYNAAVVKVFETLDWAESLLSQQRYLAGSHLTEADWRLFTTLIRFDSVYFGHFKCNLRPLSSYSALSNYLRDLFQHKGIEQTVDIAQMKQHYYESHATINPTGVVPIGPELNLHAPHNRNSYHQQPMVSSKDAEVA